MRHRRTLSPETPTAYAMLALLDAPAEEVVERLRGREMRAENAPRSLVQDTPRG